MKINNLRYDGLKDFATGVQQGDLVRESFLEVVSDWICSQVLTDF